MSLATKEQAGVLQPPTAPLPTTAANIELLQQTTPSLPEEPLVVIEPGGVWVPVNFRDVWNYRELLYFLVWRDLKVRYKQTVLGVLWVVIQPLLTTLIFTVFLGMLARVPSEGVPYALLIFTGLMPWAFFSSSVVSSGNSLVGNAHLVTKVYFPRMIIPMASVAGRLVDFGIAFIVLAGLMVYYGVPLTSNLLVLPVLVALVTLLSLAVGMLLSALNVVHRDVGVILPVAVQLWMFVSPVVYPSSLVSEKWRWLYALNPLVGIIENFRASLFGRGFNWPALAVSVVVTLGLLVCSAYIFQRMEKRFADII